MSIWTLIRRFLPLECGSMPTKINWKKVWEEFDDKTSPVHKPCKTCNRTEIVYIELEDQQKLIMKLVNKQLKEAK